MRVGIADPLGWASDGPRRGDRRLTQAKSIRLRATMMH
jgi:hypothetical protein